MYVCVCALVCLRFSNLLQVGEQQADEARQQFDEWRDAFEDETDLTEQQCYDLEQYAALIETGKTKEKNYFEGDHRETPCLVPPEILYPAITNYWMLNEMDMANIHDDGTTPFGNCIEHGNVAMWASVLHPEGEHYDGEGCPSHAAEILARLTDLMMDYAGTGSMLPRHRLLFELTLRAKFEWTYEAGNTIGAIFNNMMYLEEDNYRLFRALVEATAGMINDTDTVTHILGTFNSLHDKVKRKELLALIAHRNNWSTASILKFVEDEELQVSAADIAEAIDEKTRADSAKWATDLE